MFFSNRLGKSVAISRFFLRGLKTLRPFIQFGCFAGAFYIAISRISDYRHHPTDVIAGKNKSILGLVLTIKITALHRGAFCQFSFWWIYYCHSSKSIGKETGKTQLCALWCDDHCARTTEWQNDGHCSSVGIQDNWIGVNDRQDGLLRLQSWCAA